MTLPFEKVYDISVQLGGESIDFPGDVPYSRKSAKTVEKGGICNISTLTMSSHAGTHIDTPLHFIPGAKGLDDYGVRDFIRPALVIEVEDEGSIEPIHLENVELGRGEALLFKTANSRRGRLTSGVFSEDFVSLSPEAADFCVEKKWDLIGIDYVTIGKFGEESVDVHKKLLGHGILILEGINLKDVPPGRYTLICLPLRIKGCEGSPVRAVLLK